MKTKLLNTIAAVLISGSLLAQLAPAPNPGTSTPLGLRLHEKAVLREIELGKALEKQKRAKTVYGPNGQIRQAMSVTPTGHIIYTTTYNIGAGRTLSTNKVWPGGAIGVALTGAGMTDRLGIWDGGKVLNAHQEFNNRVTQPDAAQSLSDHATHVAATMIASGVSANAKGMSYLAPLKAYDWNDDAYEMQQAAQLGMLISNHSYGTISGWNYDTDNSRWEWWGDRNISTVTDYKFGQYDERAAEWDEIAAAYPYYLICKAAGNDRGDIKSGTDWYYSDGTTGTGTPPGKDGGTSGYDCIPQYGTAKNILTVGAVNKIGGNTGNGWTKASDVVMSNFSGWGPTDDGRIKPDVVAPGVGIYSAISTGTGNYDTLSGTSMATPAASGSLLLVQQHHNNVKGRYMRSATLKALAIHTADEAGSSTGPDYTFGWGLLNTASCVKFINDSNFNKLEERTLNNGQTQTLQFNVDAGKPLRITICWTDQPGVPATSNLLNNPKKMLVNDLDIRLTRVSDQQKFNPYILDPAAPASPATTGDNTRDNVEMIHLAAPNAGIYTLTVSHKGALSSSQPFSLLVSNGVEKAAAAFTSDKTVICPARSIQFTDASSGGVTSRKWYFPGGSPATSTAANPTVSYATAGNYAVALKVTSALGEDSVYIKNYITVGGLPLPFTETFEENSPTSNTWTVSNPDADVTWAYYNTAGTSTGERSAGINYFDYSPAFGYERDGLISPPISLKGFSNPVLTFKHAYTRYDVNSKSDSLIVYASTNCGTSWTRLAVFAENGSGSFATFGESNGYSSNTSFVPATAEDWCGGTAGATCKTVPLGMFTGNPSVVLKFEGFSNFSNNMFLDNITVSGTPLKPVAAIATAQTTVCVNTPVTFNDASQNNPSGWVWSLPGATPSTSTAQNPVVTYSTPGTYSVKLKASNITGADSLELLNYITVVAQPAAPNIKASGALQFCLGDSVLLQTDSTGPVKWYKDDVLIAQNTQQVYASKTGSFRVARSNGTCEASSSLNVTASVKDATPTITATVTGTAFCTGASSTLTSSAASGNQWYRNNVAINGATNKTYIATDSGSYTVISNSAGCPSESSLPKTYTLFPNPIVGTISGPDNPKRDETVTYSVPGEAGHTYQWTIVNGNITGGNNTSSITAKFTVVDSATISVVAKSTASSCLSTASVKRILVAPATGIDEASLTTYFTVYPVPAKNRLNIEFESAESTLCNLKVVNLLGQVIVQKEFNVVSGTNRSDMDVSLFKKGIYFIELHNRNHKTVKKFIVE